MLLKPMESKLSSVSTFFFFAVGLRRAVKAAALHILEAVVITALGHILTAISISNVKIRFNLTD